MCVPVLEGTDCHPSLDGAHVRLLSYCSHHRSAVDGVPVLCHLHLQRTHPLLHLHLPEGQVGTQNHR